MQISAIADRENFNLSAAVSSLSPTVRRLMASANVSLTGKISVHDLDAKLATAERMSTVEKLTLKIGLERQGLLGN
jgi:hypothetical protein